MTSYDVTFLIKETQRDKGTALSLCRNDLSSLPSEVLELKNLTYLDVSENRLLSLPPKISELKNLKTFYLYRNQLSFLPLEISNLKNLTELYLYENQLISLPPEISELKNLKKLDVSSNKLSTLPSEISELKNLIHLDLSRNQLISLPPEISELKNIAELLVYNNQLQFLPPEISKLKNLTKIDISENKLNFLSPELFELKNLTELNLSRNQLSSLPSEISKLNDLRKLDLSFNNLRSLPSEISELKNLTELNLSGNQLSFLPSEVSELNNLKTLYMSSNELYSFPLEILTIKNLTELNLSENHLSSLPSEISEFKNLTELNLSENHLSALPSEISRLKKLKKLDLSFNKFDSLNLEILDIGLEIELENYWKLGRIYLNGNNLVNPPLEIIKRGREAIINYLKSLEEEKKPLNEVKVLLVGEGGAGKTSLAKRLFGEMVDGNESQTQGINIRKWVIKNGEREIKANFWDFGGQEIMHATHQFFLSKRSLYILVLDGRKDEKPEYWLKLIENFGGDSPILVVINKIDENPAFELNRKFLKEKYPSIKGKGFFRLSCKSNEGVEEFSGALQEELTKVKHLEIKWPKSWFNVKSRLEKICPSHTTNSKNKNTCEYFNFIEYKDYKMMCDEEGIKSESEQYTLVDFLHDLGVILHFKDIPLLNTHVIEPEWVTNAVYRLVNSKEIAKSRGVLKLDMFAEILKQRTERDFYYPPDQYSFFINLMEKFELAYELDDSTVLLPSLLEIQEPDFELDGNLSFIIDYDFLPPSVMPRFIVKMNKDIKDNLRWRTGVFLENKEFNSIAVVRADIEAKRVSIYVKGEQKRDYLAVILQKYREINKSFEKLKAIEKIPLPDKPEVTVSYEHLMKLESKGVENYIPDGSDHEYNVRDLLGTVLDRSNERALE